MANEDAALPSVATRAPTAVELARWLRPTWHDTGRTSAWAGRALWLRYFAQPASTLAQIGHRYSITGAAVRTHLIRGAACLAADASWEAGAPWFPWASELGRAILRERDAAREDEEYRRRRAALESGTACPACAGKGSVRAGRDYWFGDADAPPGPAVACEGRFANGVACCLAARYRVAVAQADGGPPLDPAHDAPPANVCPLHLPDAVRATIAWYGPPASDVTVTPIAHMGDMGTVLVTRPDPAPASSVRDPVLGVHLWKRE